MHDLQPLMLESAQLMLIGMGTVFIILIMLIFLINIVNKGLTLLNPEDEAESVRTVYSRTLKIPATADNELIAVISSAISRYRKQHYISNK